MAAAAVILTGALDSLATRTAERASRSALLWLPPASYGALVVGAAAAVGYKWWTSSSRRLSARPDGFLATLLGAIAPSENSKAAQVRSLGCACTAGAAAASRDALRFVQVNLDPTSTPDTLELLSIPTLVVFLAAPHSPWRGASIAETPSFATVAVLTLVSVILFALVGSPIRCSTIALGLLRAALQAASLCLLHDGLSALDGAFQFLLIAAGTASTLSLASMPALNRLPHLIQAETIAGSTPSFGALLATRVAAETCLYGLLYASPTPFIGGLAPFPRNLALVWLSPSAYRDAPAAQSRLVQTILLYLAGTAAVCWSAGSEAWGLGDLVRKFRSQPSPYLKLSENEEEVALTRGSTDSWSSRRDVEVPDAQGTSPVPAGDVVRLSLLPLAALALLAILSPFSSRGSDTPACSVYPALLRPAACPPGGSLVPNQTVDIVIAYHHEDPDLSRIHIANVRRTPFVSARENRVVVYNKGPRQERDLRDDLGLGWQDEVVPLPNIGREGATYLKHILLHYNSTETTAPTGALAAAASHLRRQTLADMTYFFQGHRAWPELVRPRLEEISDRTGFAQFGPNIPMQCGRDMRVNLDFPMIEKLWPMFRGEPCEPGTKHLGGWSAQFAVSKQRILANPYERYAHLSGLIEAPEGHWIHDDWGPNDSGGPSNPIFGHAVERAWPFFFNCSDTRIVEGCPAGESRASRCQCFDV